MRDFDQQPVVVQTQYGFSWVRSFAKARHRAELWVLAAGLLCLALLFWHFYPGLSGDNPAPLYIFSIAAGLLVGAIVTRLAGGYTPDVHRGLPLSDQLEQVRFLNHTLTVEGHSQDHSLVRSQSLSYGVLTHYSETTSALYLFTTPHNAFLLSKEGISEQDLSCIHALLSQHGIPKKRLWR